MHVFLRDIYQRNVLEFLLKSPVASISTQQLQTRWIVVGGSNIEDVFAVPEIQKNILTITTMERGKYDIFPKAWDSKYF